MSFSKVFVGNFDFSVDDYALREFFEEIGSVVSAKVMKDSVTGKSRGFGFVEFSSSEHAKKAIEKFNGKDWEGRSIKVCEERRRGKEDDYDDGKQAPMGFFRAQPLELGPRKTKKQDFFLENPNLKIDYKDVKTLSRFVSERGRILPRRMTGLTAAHQRRVSKAIKRAQHLSLMPYVS